MCGQDFSWSCCLYKYKEEDLVLQMSVVMDIETFGFIMIGCVGLSMVSRTDCIALYVDRTAGSQTCGHNEF